MIIAKICHKSILLRHLHSLPPPHYKDPYIMLKTRAAAVELLKKRVAGNEARQRKNLILNDSDFQVIGAACQGFSPSLLVNSEGQSYLFNCGEGLQRLCYSNKIRLSSLENVFITNLQWDRVAGLFGLSLTLQDIGCPKLTVTSVDGIKDFFKATENFIAFNTGIQCTTRSCFDGKIENRGMTITPVVLDAVDSITVKDDGKRVKYSPRLVAYICELPDLNGSLDPQKCRELNVPIGPKLAILKSGKDVTLADGRVVKSADVCGPMNKGKRFLIVECVKEKDIDRLILNGTIDQERKARPSETSRQIDMVIHFSPKDIIEDGKYQRWMDGFSEDCKHLLISDFDQNTKVNFVESYRLQHLMRELDCDIFPAMELPECFSKRVLEERAPDSRNEPVIGDFDDNNSVVSTYVKGSIGELDRVIRPASLDKFKIRPNGLVEGADQRIAIDAIIQEAKLDPEFEKRLSALRKLQSELPKPKEYEPEVVFLGTGSAMPSKYRNTSCILINFTHPEKYSVILDCGEDSYGQLYRHYGPEQTKEILNNLKMVYVSHQHADHHLGFISIIRERSKLTQEPLALLIPPGIGAFLDFHNQNFQDLSHCYKIFSTRDLKAHSQESGITPIAHVRDRQKERLYSTMGNLLENISVVPVNHCKFACATVFKFKIGHKDMDTWTVAYSGDARPSEEFAIFGRDCDLLIHEGTFDPQNSEDAILKKHCTTEEAIEVGKQMQAKFTLLTHFSQRHAKIPTFNDKFDDKVGFAFDNLSLRCPSQLPRLPILKNMLSLVFQKAVVETEMKYHKRELAIKRARDLMEAKKGEQVTR